MKHQLSICSVEKQFKDKEVLKGLSLDVTADSILGIIGENGAGKTTLFKAVLGLVLIDKGSITVDGKDINAGDTRQREIGFLLEPRFYPYLSAYGNIEEVLIASGQYTKESKSEIMGLLAFLNLAEVANKRVGRFSFGMKQRLGLAQALITHPKVLLLDEPFVGLDPLGAQSFREKIEELHQSSQCTTILTSHQLNDVQEICDEVAVLQDGRIAVHDKTENLIEDFTVFAFQDVISDLKPETRKCEKDVHLSGDHKKIFVKNGTQDDFRLISNLYGEYELVNVTHEKSGLERFFEEGA
jgi:ABC-type multidrug transport system, ATPase component